MFTYAMSEVGGCPLVLVGRRLGLKPNESSRFLDRTAREGSRHEAHVSEDLREAGFDVVGGSYCAPCEREGTHVDLDILGPEVRLVGHIDRLAAPIGQWSNPKLVEIKSLSRFRAPKLWNSLKGGTFAQDWTKYAYQVSCYHYASHLPIMYVVKNRDTGQTNWIEIEPPVSLEDIALRIADCEYNVANGIFPDCTCEFDCPYAWLKPSTQVKGDGWALSGQEYEPVHIQAVVDYLEAKQKLDEANKVVEESKETLKKAISASTGGEFGSLVFTLADGRKFKANHYPIKGRKTYPKKNLLNFLTEEQLEQAAHIGKSSDGLTVEEVM